MLAKHWVGGESLDAGPSAFESRNPARPDEVVAEVPEGGASAVAAAVEAAASAQAAWAARPAAERSALLHAWAEDAAAHAEGWAQAAVREVGKPVAEALGEAGRCVALLRYYAGEAVRPQGEVVPALTAGSLQYAVRRPLGVVGLVTPWNFPFAIPLWKAAPALAFGNAVVLKPSEASAWCAALLAESSARAGIPAGVFNVVHGGAETGKGLVLHPGVSAVSFTGSVEAGKSVATACAARNAKCQAEMGGKNAGIVLADADLPRAAALVAGGAVRFAGQKCTATSRAVVAAEVHDEFASLLKEALEALPCGDPAERPTAVGPVIDAAAVERIESALDGHRPAWRGGTPPGHGVAPALVLDVDPASHLAQDEVFGPVLAVVRADGPDHAVEIANGVKYGLSAALYTRSVGEALRLVPRIEAGLVRVNGDTTGVDLHAPFGGVKASSSGSREQGTAAREFYTEYQTVQVNA